MALTKAQIEKAIRTEANLDEMQFSLLKKDGVWHWSGTVGESLKETSTSEKTLGAMNLEEWVSKFKAGQNKPVELKSNHEPVEAKKESANTVKSEVAPTTVNANKSHAFRDWMHKQSPNDMLPRGRFFKGREAGAYA
ncbi:hypothetical protein [Psychromonas sp. SP041]|uniref:hypothetical protein n=1 Tax=Psychromonas sp. SP041 TaxID=1365007 RepID=UPI0010C774A3|nr:hypothetical protein [Psychromonas sp. SP041]